MACVILISDGRHGVSIISIMACNGVIMAMIALMALMAY